MGILTFDDPRCMSASEFGLDVNKMMINHVITRWHSHPDAAFKTRVQDLYPTSMMQKRGLCIQSSKYPRHRRHRRLRDPGQLRSSECATAAASRGARGNYPESRGPADSEKPPQGRWTCRSLTSQGLPVQYRMVSTTGCRSSQASGTPIDPERSLGEWPVGFRRSSKNGHL
jgi:hypothetical protein